ncbi:unannotated protein [freshwater metagenome]|uniref:Unannotated protein n=1 Tax=freshwater metagenome TaxID=449393 RepID=A0A6J7JD18_9ZZZZ
MPSPTADAWAPLRRPIYRGLLLCQFASNVGTWMQVVGAQWLMGDLTSSVTAVALVQTAVTLPVFLAVLPAGALGDLLDRRVLLIASQGGMAVVAAILALMTEGGMMTPWLLLSLTFLLGMGQAVVVPSWHAIQPELVPREEIPQAVTLHGVNVNFARAVGPAIGGLVIAAVGPAAVFGLNALSFGFSVIALARWKRVKVEQRFATEGFLRAMRAGGAYVRATPPMRILLMRLGAFMVFASALWTLLPIVARDRLDLSSTGYGLLLAAAGIGAATGVVTLPPLRRRFSTNAIIGLSSGAFGIGLLVLGLSHSVVPDVVVLPVLGLAWVATLSSMMAAAQSMLPAWSRARGLSWYVVVVMGGQAGGSILWGLVAEHPSLTFALVLTGAGLVGNSISGRWLPVNWLNVDLEVSQHWPQDDLDEELPDDAGPFHVRVRYAVQPGAAAQFRKAMEPVSRQRRRTGATRWVLREDPQTPGMFIESWYVPLWIDHQRQHRERTTMRDREIEEAALAFLVPGTEPAIERVLAEPPRRLGLLRRRARAS